MAMRMTGMYSGMDTESIIQELVSAKRTKVDDVKKKQTKLEWKQDDWKDLNTKLKNLQSKYISNMRFASSYMKKTTAVPGGKAACKDRLFNRCTDEGIRQRKPYRTVQVK